MMRAASDVEPISRILYGIAAADGHSSRPVIAERLKRPTRKFGVSSRDAFWISLPGIPSLFGLAPCGVCHAPCIAARAVRSYRTFSPLPRPPNISGSAGLRLLCLCVQLKADRLSPFTYVRRYIFCGTFRRATPAPRRNALLKHPPGRYPAHCSVEFGLSSLLAVQPGETRRSQPGRRPSGSTSATHIIR
jgi:hypothetical protein